MVAVIKSGKRLMCGSKPPANELQSLPVEEKKHSGILGLTFQFLKSRPRPFAGWLPSFAMAS